MFIVCLTLNNTIWLGHCYHGNVTRGHVNARQQLVHVPQNASVLCRESRKCQQIWHGNRSCHRWNKTSAMDDGEVERCQRPTAWQRQWHFFLSPLPEQLLMWTMHHPSPTNMGMLSMHTRLAGHERITPSIWTRLNRHRLVNRRKPVPPWHCLTNNAWPFGQYQHKQLIFVTLHVFPSCHHSTKQ